MPIVTPLRFRVTALLFAAVVLAVSSWPGFRLPRLGSGDFDKVLHFGQYAVLAFLVVRGWCAGVEGWRRGAIWAILAMLIVFAAADEYHQGWIPHRDPDWFDWGADVLGIVAGWWTGLFFIKRNRTAHSDSVSPTG